MTPEERKKYQSPLGECPNTAKKKKQKKRPRRPTPTKARRIKTPFYGTGCWATFHVQCTDDDD